MRETVTTDGPQSSVAVRQPNIHPYELQDTHWVWQVQDSVLVHRLISSLFHSGYVQWIAAIQITTRVRTNGLVQIF